MKYTAFLILLFAVNAAAQTFTNPAQINIPDSGAANLYPSQISVSGVAGNIPNAPGSVKVRINRFSHTFPGDVNMVMVGPTGAAFLIQSNAGGGIDAVNITYTISDAAGTPMPEPASLLDSGVYKPTNHPGGSDNFPAPGPGSNYHNPGPLNDGAATFASVFGGTNPNGIWKLFVYDEFANDSGSIAGGWSIAFGAGETDLFAPSKFSFGAGDEGIGDRFGGSISASTGDRMIVGANADDINGNSGQGSAYVFARGADGFWHAQQKLLASDGAAGDFFGTSVAIIGNTAVVGAYGDDVNGNSAQGSAYVFVRSGSSWVQQAKLTASDGAAGDNFGLSVAITEGKVIVGAPFDDIGANSNQGSAYVFARSGDVWSQQAKLTAPLGAAEDQFGNSVAVYGFPTSFVVIGSYLDDIGGADAGSALVFINSGTDWNYHQRLTAGDGAASNGFGYHVGIAVDSGFEFRIIVGAPFDDIGANTDQGSAYVFRRPLGGTVWTEEQKLTARGGALGDRFGISVAISDDQPAKIVIGADLDDHGSNESQGSAYVFRRSGTTWRQSGQLFAFDGRENDHFGNSLAITGDTVFAGVPDGNINGLNNVGAGYLFRLGGKPFDFDEDARTDISIYRPPVGEWWYLRSSDAGNRAAQFGASTDRIVPADFSGDGKTDLAFWRPATGEWFILRSEDSSYYSLPFGSNGDIPAPADYDGDGRADTAVFRPSNATWYIGKSSGGTIIQQFGAAGDVPVAADYDGDGRGDVAIYRPSNGQWWIQRSAGMSTVAFQFGTAADKPVSADYTGDGKADAAFWRASTGEWFFLRSESSSFYSFPFGAFEDIPAAGDYDGDGRADAAVFRPSNATWYMQQSAAGSLAVQFGFSTDKPVPAAFVP